MDQAALALSAPLNPQSDLTAEYDELVAAAVRRYGGRGQGVGLVLHEQLVFLRRLLADHPDNAVLAARVAMLRQALPSYYRTDPTGRVRHRSWVVSEEPLILEFDREAFQKYRYAEVADAVHADTAVLASRCLDGLMPARTYLYVIDDAAAIRVWRRPFRFVDLAFGRDRARVRGVPVAHPMLVPERLRVMAAGEVVFVGGSDVAAVIANTKSGHFRPPPSTAEVVRGRFAEALGLGSGDIDVIAIS